MTSLCPTSDFFKMQRINPLFYLIKHPCRVLVSILRNNPFICTI